MYFPEVINTERLILRVPMPGDADEMFARYAHDSEVTRYLSWRPHSTVKQTQEFVERLIVERREGKTWSWLVHPRSSGPLIGSIGCRVNGGPLQFGYCLARDVWGYGYATEAARALVATAFANDAVWRLQAFCDIENPASARVLEKAGLVMEGTLRRYLVMPNLGDAPRDVFCYAKVRQ